MKFYTYWAKGSAEHRDAHGKPVRFCCWGASDESIDVARATAVERAARALARVLSSGYSNQRYPYGVAALREEVLQKFTNARGDLIAAITTNGYGALVLNTAGTMFVDIDLPDVPVGELLRHLVGRWFGRRGPAPAERREREARQCVEVVVRRGDGWGARLYRTTAGFRLLVTHALFDPADDVTQAAFESLGADPTYLRLCRHQRSFRARLTPKPWRCGQTKNVIPWPRETPAAEAAFEAWRARYLECQAGFATCRLVDVLGSRDVHPDAEQITAIHDEVTKIDQALPLA